jgi:hypothetical protein
LETYLDRHSLLFELLATILRDSFLRIGELFLVPRNERHPRALSSCQLRNLQADATGSTRDDDMPPLDGNRDCFQREVEIRQDRDEAHGEHANHHQGHAPCRPHPCPKLPYKTPPSCYSTPPPAGNNTSKIHAVKRGALQRSVTSQRTEKWSENQHCDPPQRQLVCCRKMQLVCATCVFQKKGGQNRYSS